MPKLPSCCGSCTHTLCLLCRHLPQVQPSQAGVGWARTKSWVEAAAAQAPLATEALLHSFITSSDSLPGATAPAWVREARPGEPRLGEVLAIVYYPAVFTEAHGAWQFKQQLQV
jgi:hypothetical protein